jgi:hypothetical protein
MGAFEALKKIKPPALPVVFDSEPNFHWGLGTPSRTYIDYVELAI